MPTETTVGIISLKSGLLAAFLAFLVAACAVAVGFTIVPLTPGREMLDAARRLAAGLFCSFTVGPFVALKVFEWFPGLLDLWAKLLPGTENLLWVYLAGAAPVIAMCGLIGFWAVALVVRHFERRKHMDLGELARDTVDTARSVVERRP